MLTTLFLAFVATFCFYLVVAVLPLPGSDCTLVDLVDEWFNR